MLDMTYLRSFRLIFAATFLVVGSTISFLNICELLACDCKNTREIDYREKSQVKLPLKPMMAKEWDFGVSFASLKSYCTRLVPESELTFDLWNSVFEIDNFHFFSTRHQLRGIFKSRFGSDARINAIFIKKADKYILDSWSFVNDAGPVPK
jgi:hypothetical protein